MENEDTTNDESKTATNLSPATSKKQTRKERSKANAASQKSSEKQKHTFWRNWNELSRTRQLELVLLGIVAMGGIGYLCVTIWGNLQTKWNFEASHKPIVVHNRPPELLQAFACFPGAGFSTGNMRIFSKNIGNATADKSNDGFIQTRVVSESKTGHPILDEPPLITDDACRHRPNFDPSTDFSLPAGMQRSSDLRQSAGMSTLGTYLKKGAPVQFYIVPCIYYLDGDGQEHGTCDTYRLLIPSSEPIDRLLGTPSIKCDGRQVTGHFYEAVTGHCQT